MTENRTVQQKSVRRNRLVAAACFAASLITVSVVGTQSASADGAAHDAAPRAAAATRPAAAAAPGLGSARLVQSEDFRRGPNPVGATVVLTGRQALSACSGEETMRDLTKEKATAYAAVTWTFDTKGGLTESAASAPTETAAATWEQQLVTLVQDCQDEPAGHWRYGAAHTLTAAGGTAHWYPAYNGDGTAGGGVAVLRSGTRVAVVELTGQSADAPAAVEGIATAALNRLSS
ncbi:hypothetical protein [Streptomyces rubellomurinus]|uniref:PknH-like extracellular domain-containing protein n=1 Tax=Streptomyces rubellomurinus (strain ATCC 31215) TaxID=359131 RepID=A0A0F2T885_STRR3|nr:hypothetical protein [Streptomyces rubellomurinus]KJS58535.1 hypothetical protein VM95_32640 [Streptomyces rubellomurinus]